MKLSVVITTRNEEANIANCIRAFDRFRDEVEVIVVDNASTDRTQELARELGATVLEKGPERSAQRNLGWRTASAPWVIVLDADMILPEETIREILALGTEGDVDAYWIPEVRTGDGLRVKARNFERSFYDGTAIDALRLFRRCVLDKTGGYDENLIAGPEDWELDIRVLATGAKCAVLKHHLLHNERLLTLRRMLGKKAYYAKSMAAYQAKWKGHPALKKQFSLAYRYFGVFVEGGKWKRLVRHPILAAVMFVERILVGFVYLANRKASCAAILLALALACPCAHAAYFTPPHPLRHLTNAVATAGGPRSVAAGLLSASDDALPAKYDLRDEDGTGTSHLSPIRNQGSHGTCWAHAAMVGIEYLICRDEGIDADLSENNLANMHGFAPAFDIGGTSDMANAVFLREEGPVTENLDPYVHIGASFRERGVRIPRKIVFVPARSFLTSRGGISKTQLNADNEAIKRALVKYGPLSTSYYHHDSYLTGAAYYCNVAYGANHAVSIVGWDDDYAASNFRATPQGDGAFIIKNSWGTSWFDKGYTYISYYDKTLGFEPQMAYARLSNGEDYGRLYEYDRMGRISCVGYGSTTAHAMNVFTARTNEVLAAFGFYALAQGTTYSAKVVVDPVVENGVLSGTETEVGSGTLSEAGYEVLDFTTSVSVSAGQKFAIVVKVTTPDDLWPIPVTQNETLYDGTPYVTNVVAEAGLCYATKDPTSYAWNDISSDGQYFCCKVYTKPASAERTTCGMTSVPHTWLDAYAALQGSAYLSAMFYGAYNALSEHVAANGKTIEASYAKGLDPDNATETNLVATISFDEAGKPVIGVSPKNTSLWSYFVLGSRNLQSWHNQAEDDTFFKVSLSPK